EPMPRLTPGEHVLGTWLRLQETLIVKSLNIFAYGSSSIPLAVPSWRPSAPARYVFVDNRGPPLESINALDRKVILCLYSAKKVASKSFLRTQKSVHAIIIVEIPKLLGEMLDLKDFDHVFEQENGRNIARCKRRRI
ncbi:hypothetical protein L9F63_026402, partial [Diploptera punctata]